MIEWFSALNGFEQTLYVIAAVSSVLFAIKGILLAIGISDLSSLSDAADAADAADADDMGVSYLSVFGVLSFITVGSWGTILAYTISDSYVIALLIGILSGAAEMFASVKIIRGFKKLQDSGNIDTKTAIGKIGEVYLSIPPMDLGEGKVNLVINSGLKEFDAVSQDKTPIPTGARVRVVGIGHDDVLIVQRECEELGYEE